MEEENAEGSSNITAILGMMMIAKKLKEEILEQLSHQQKEDVVRAFLSYSEAVEEEKSEAVVVETVETITAIFESVEN